METTTKENDLGVTFTNYLKFTTHIAKAVNKDNRVMGVIRQSSRDMDKDVFLHLYKTLIRGHLEHTNTIFNPIKMEMQTI